MDEVFQPEKEEEDSRWEKKKKLAAGTRHDPARSVDPDGSDSLEPSIGVSHTPTTTGLPLTSVTEHLFSIFNHGNEPVWTCGPVRTRYLNPRGGFAL